MVSLVVYCTRQLHFKEAAPSLQSSPLVAHASLSQPLHRTVTAPPDSVLPLHMGTCTSVSITHMSHCGPRECSPLRLHLSPFSYPASPSASSAGMSGFSYLLSHIKIPFLMNCPFPSTQSGLPLCSAPATPLGSCTLQHLPKISSLWSRLPLLRETN